MSEDGANDEHEEYEVEVTEISLTDEEINNLISHLNELKNSKTEFTFEIDDENELLIKYQNDEDESEIEDNEEGKGE